MLLPIIADEDNTMEIASFTAQALRFICVDSCDSEITATILQVLIERSGVNHAEKWTCFVILRPALLYLCRQDESDTTLGTLEAIEHSSSRQAQILVEISS